MNDVPTSQTRHATPTRPTRLTMTPRHFAPSLRTLAHAITALLVSASFLGLHTSDALALPTPGEVAAMQRKRAVAEEEARQEIETLFSRLCPGRCELIEVTAVTSSPGAVGEVTPGFDGLGAVGAYDVKVTRLEARVMIDSTLPRAFMANIPKMLRFRLQRIVPDVRIQPVALEFPKPQMEPMAQPEPIEEPPEEPPAPEPEIEEPPAPEPEVEEPPVVEPEPETSWLRELWQTFLPYLPYIVLLLILFAIIRTFLNWFRDNKLARHEPTASGAGDGDVAKPMPDSDALRRELTRSRAVQNEVLRLWLREDAESVAILVRMVGPDVLQDVKQDPALRASLAEVSAQAARHSEPLSSNDARRVAQETRARITAARIMDAENNLQGDWDFVQGLTVPTLQRITSKLAAREKGFAIGQLPAALRASFLEQLSTRERRELFMDAGSSEGLDREQAVALATRLREEAESIAHLGDAASGQAAVVIDMLRAVSLSEQEDTLQEISRRRPEIAQAVFSQVCLESTALVAPHDVVSDAMLRTPIETLTAMLRGTRDDVREFLVEQAPSNIRAALIQELELGIPASRSEYLEAREIFTDTLASILQREGEDLVAMNARAMARRAGPDA